MSVWNPENVTDVAESIGIASLHPDVQSHLARDVEYRLSSALIEALKFMRHAKRTTLTTQDISQALRLLDVEPLYGYESTRPLRFGEASIGPGQPLWYVEDEEVDFEKLINAPLPKVPREIAFTAHWLAVEGVQPSIPQNPSKDAAGTQDAASKTGAAATNPTLAAMSGGENVGVKPLVKHVLSKELQLYFERICAAVLDQTNEEYRTAALMSLRTDPGIHQLLPYFVQWVADKVTHNLKSIWILSHTLQMVHALLDNSNLMLSPYVPSIVPAVLTCLIGKHLGNPSVDGPNGHFQLRDFSASLLSQIAQKYGPTSSTLKPRIARSCLKDWLDRHKPFGTHYGAILGLTMIAGPAGVRSLILPNLKVYDQHLNEGLQGDKKEQAEMVVDAILRALMYLEQDSVHGASGANGHPEGAALQARLAETVGEVVGQRLVELKRPAVVDAVLEKDVLV
ncbi:DUF1546-domain-containing protein [Teratosphaeria nubilosa]|uniref:TBP-associated factor 6 n=1 Tax=Teratosphaeria nubilosa TaxID=161662 RepID=A0A6G1LC36_9PEZI|nr:DUF1546-domain-containing protein [Teratosphaeria nubilosa]